MCLRVSEHASTNAITHRVSVSRFHENLNFRKWIPFGRPKNRVARPSVPEVRVTSRVPVNGGEVESSKTISSLRVTLSFVTVKSSRFGREQIRVRI